MTYPFGDESRRSSRRSVPLEKAKKIANQRDRLAEEVQKLRRQNEHLAEARAEAEAERKTLEERIADAEEHIDELRKALQAKAKARHEGQSDEPRAEEGPSERSDTDETREHEESGAELVDKLKRRIAGLTDDLDRVRQQANETETKARRDERIRLLSEFGSILGSVEQGLSMATDENERQGLEGIYSQILNFLGREGATLTGEVGASMDPHIHEAVDTVEGSDYESGQIAEVVRRGVELEDGTVVIPAKVRVAA